MAIGQIGKLDTISTQAQMEVLKQAHKPAEAVTSKAPAVKDIVTLSQEAKNLVATQAQKSTNEEAGESAATQLKEGE